MDYSKLIIDYKIGNNSNRLGRAYYRYIAVAVYIAITNAYITYSVTSTYSVYYLQYYIYLLY